MSLNIRPASFRFTTGAKAWSGDRDAVSYGRPTGNRAGEGISTPWLVPAASWRSPFTWRAMPDGCYPAGTFEGRATGTPISLQIGQCYARPPNMAKARRPFRPAMPTLRLSCQIWDFATGGGGGRSSAANGVRVAAGATARLVIRGVTIRPVR